MSDHKHIIFLFLLGMLVVLSSIIFVSESLAKKVRRGNADVVQTAEFLSKIYHVDKIYKSMTGPTSSQKVVLLKTDEPELLWMTGYRTTVVAADGETEINQEFLCHNNLDFDTAYHSQIFGWNKVASSRMFTLSQGQFSIEFPEGFGIPVMSNESFSLATQVLNHNLKNADEQMRHKVFVDFIRDKDLKEPLKPLFSTNAFVMALLEGRDGDYGVRIANEIQQQATCLPGLHADSAGSGSIYPDGFGRKFSGHWVVKPGREVRDTLVTKTLNIPFDSTIHYIALHLHPFAESLELKDLTANRSLFKSKITGPKEGIGISHVEDFSSVKGIDVYKDHEYELTSVYNNTSGVDQDAMATMFIYLLDKEFKKPDVAYVKTQLNDIRKESSKGSGTNPAHAGFQNP